MQVNLHVMLSLVHMVNVSAAMVLCKQDAPVTNVYACVVLCCKLFILHSYSLNIMCVFTEVVFSCIPPLKLYLSSLPGTQVPGLV